MTKKIKSLKKEIPNLKDCSIGVDFHNKFEMLESLSEKEECHIIPVIMSKFLRDFRENYLGDIKKIIVRVKLPISFNEPEMPELIAYLEKRFPDTSVIFLLDLGEINEEKEERDKYTYLKEILAELKENNFLGNVIISSTSFPEDISKIKSGSFERFPKNEMPLFKKAIEGHSGLNFIYSDYCISRNVDTDIDFSKLDGSKILKKIRYTTEKEYLVLKGRNKNDKKLETKLEFQDLVIKLMDSKEFMGEEYSYGDREIAKKLIPSKSPGSNEQFIRFGTNHHLVLILKQLSQDF